MKATYGEVEGRGKEIYKDPKTDDGLKKSAKGLLTVMGTTKLYLQDQQDWDGEEVGNLEPIFEDGQLLKNFTLEEVRDNLWNE